MPQPDGILTPKFKELMARLAAIPAELTAARGCICGAEVTMFTGRRTGYIWVRHGIGPRSCPREGFECRLEPGTPEPFTAYEEVAPELPEIVSNKVDEFAPPAPVKDEWDF